MFEKCNAASNDNRRHRSVLAPVNRVSLSGCLAADPDVLINQCGCWIVHLLLATRDVGHRSSASATLQRVVVVNHKLARFAGEQLAEGQHVHIEGQLQTRALPDEQGRHVVTTEIVLSSRNAKLAPLEEPIQLPCLIARQTERAQRSLDMGACSSSGKRCP